MRSYGQYCPIAKAAEVLGDRWTLLIMRELVTGSTHFNQFERGLPRISRSLLAQRLRRLEREGLVERHAGPGGRSTGYRLTPAGREVKKALEVLGHWAARWVVGDPSPEELDPGVIVWFMHRHVDRAQLPTTRTVVRFDFHQPRRERYWLVIDPDEVSVCLQHPGFEEDLVVTADTVALHRVYLGRMTLSEAMAENLIRVEGLPRLVRSFPRWFTWSHFAPSVREGMRAGDGKAATRSRGRR